MPKLHLIKHSTQYLAPATEESIDLLVPVKTGSVITCEYSIMRNGNLFKKWWALVNFAFECWEPGEVEHNGDRFIPKKNSETFRKHLTVLAGYYDTTYGIDGKARIEADSISFAAMSEEEFAKLYSATVDVVLDKILTNYSRSDLEDVVLESMRSFF